MIHTSLANAQPHAFAYLIYAFVFQKMLTFVETKLRRGRSVVELVGHSVLKFAWKYATKDQYSRAINFNVLPGGTARALWLHIKSIALKRAHAGIRVTFLKCEYA